LPVSASYIAWAPLRISGQVCTRLSRCPSGNIDAFINCAIEILAKLGIRSVTFAVGATPTMEIGQNIHRVRAKVTARTYRGTVAQLKLVAKKVGAQDDAQDDAIYICYPTLGLGVSGVRTLVKFFEGEF